MSENNDRRAFDSEESREAMTGTEADGTESAHGGEATGQDRRASDAAFVDRLAERLSALSTVRAVTLGGSRAQGTHGPESDWDLALYYRGDFDPEELRAIGWPGEVSEVGGWGGGVFNGGAWLTVEDRRVDIHYRDLDVVERELAEAEQGRFHWEPLPFHLAGIPSYLIVGELAIHRVLRGTLPDVGYPRALRESAPPRWRANAEMTLLYAKANHAPRGSLAEVAGALATAAAQTAHAVLAARAEWTTNEKTLLERAGLRGVDSILGSLTPEPAALEGAIGQAEELFASTR